MLVLQSPTNAGTKLCDSGHVGRQAVHFIFHLLEVILHFSDCVCGETKGYEGYE